MIYQRLISICSNQYDVHCFLFLHFKYLKWLKVKKLTLNCTSDGAESDHFWHNLDWQMLMRKRWITGYNVKIWILMWWRTNKNSMAALHESCKTKVLCKGLLILSCENYFFQMYSVFLISPWICPLVWNHDIRLKKLIKLLKVFGS